MSRPRICDLCGKPAQIGAKIYLAPMNENDPNVKTVFSNYTASMDVGRCCIEKVTNFGKWTPRKRRKPNGSNNSVAQGKGTAAKPKAGAGSS